MKFLARFNAVAVRNAERDTLAVMFLSFCIREAANNHRIKRAILITDVTERAKKRVEEELFRPVTLSRSGFGAGVAEFNNRVNLGAIVVGITQETISNFGNRYVDFRPLVEYWKASFTQVVLRVFQGAQKGYLNISPDLALGMCVDMERASVR